MQVVRVESIDSPLLAPYRHLRTTNLTRFSGRFIAESKPLVRRLLDSDLEVESVLIDEKFLDEAQSWIPDDVRVLMVASPAISELIGFHFHRGYLACGIRPAYRSPESIVVPHCDHGERWTSVMLVGVQDPENMGSILRTCAALGIEEVWIGPECVDPFARRVLRVSMGNAFKLRFYDASSAKSVLHHLHGQGVESIAACLAADSQELATFTRRTHAVVLLGNEAHGLPTDLLQLSTRRVQIAMDLNTDSLNVSVAAGIILHNLCRICGERIA